MIVVDIPLAMGGGIEVDAVDDAAQPLGKDQRQNELLILRCIFGTTDGTCRIPDLGFEGFAIAVSVCHPYSFLCFYGHDAMLTDLFGVVSCCKKKFIPRSVRCCFYE